MTDDDKPYEVGNCKPPQTEASKATRFGGERGNPDNHRPGAVKSWSYRNVARHLSAQRIDSEDPNAIKKLIPKNPTVAERVIAAAIQKAGKGDMRAIIYLTEQVDGKVAQPTINQDFAALMGMTSDELREIADGDGTRVEASSRAHDTASEGRNPAAADGENEGDQPPDNTSGI